MNDAQPGQKVNISIDDAVSALEEVAATRFTKRNLRRFKERAEAQAVGAKVHEIRRDLLWARLNPAADIDMIMDNGDRLETYRGGVRQVDAVSGAPVCFWTAKQWRKQTESLARFKAAFGVKS